MARTPRGPSARKPKKTDDEKALKQMRKQLRKNMQSRFCEPIALTETV